MKAKLPIMLDDPQSSRLAGLDDYEEFISREEDFFLDGPVSRRVAVLDFDAQTGAIQPGARFVPPGPPGKKKLGFYEVAGPDGVYEKAFQQVCAFATVLRTMYLFEEPDALGRRLTWAFDSPQLLVIPRAGEWANAFYDRASHSLQLFYIPRPNGQPAYACLSRDVLCHETAHAILDGIVPDLQHALAPQSLALHEALADLTALLMAFRSKKLSLAVLKETNGSIADSTAFSTVAPEFGQARDPSGASRYLRSLLNRKTLDRADQSIDENGVPNRVSRFEPHSLCQVLSGALYTVMAKIHASLTTDFSSSGKALFVGRERFKRMILRALDYLPPGEVSFADYGRAILASDQAAHPDDSQEREWIREEFVRRAMVPGPATLDVETNVRCEPLETLDDLQTLATSDWAAYEFAGRHRDLLRIPEGIPFRVRPRLDTTKLYYRKKGEKPESIRELIFKVSWDHVEPNGAGLPIAGGRQVTVGTTLAIDWETRVLRARLTSEWGGEQQTDRDEALKRLLAAGALQLAGRDGEGEPGKPEPGKEDSLVRLETQDGLLRVRDTARMLHLNHAGLAGEHPPVSPRATPPPIPPPGVDAGAFYDLVENRCRPRQ